MGATVVVQQGSTTVIALPVNVVTNLKANTAAQNVVANNQVVPVSRVTNVVTAANAPITKIGGQGMQGTSGDVTYTWSQSPASATWTIPHMLDRYPSVTVTDSAGTKVFGAVDYVDANHIILTFGAPFGGFAYLN